MQNSPSIRVSGSSVWWLAALLAVTAATGLWWVAGTSHRDEDHPYPTSSRSEPAGPPWRYGRADARFTVVLYADLECPYCRAYFPTLTRWIDAHPDVNGQWHHLPLPMHEPAATQEARLAECVGQTGGHAAFWDAVAWIYQHSRGDGQGLPADAAYPGMTPAVQACLDSDRPDVTLRTQAEPAAQDGIVGTPTLQLRDRHSGKTLRLHGPVEGDALLSALDLLAGSGEPVDADSPPRTPADTAVSQPR